MLNHFSTENELFSVSPTYQKLLINNFSYLCPCGKVKESHLQLTLPFDCVILQYIKNAAFYFNKEEDH